MAVVEVVPKAPLEHLLHGRQIVVARDVAQPEAAVLGLAGQGVLHDHHRAHVVLPAEVAHVVALDPQRRLGQAQVLLQFVERPGAAVVVAGPLQAVPLERIAGVLAGGLGQAPLGAPLRHPDLHLRAPQAAQPLGVHVPGGGQFRHQHRLRVAERVLVEVDPFQDPAHQFGPREVLGPVHDEAALAHDPALAHEEHRHGGLQLVGDHPEHVGVLGPRAHHLLALDGLAHTRQAVPQPGGLLEVQRLGGGGHVGLEAPDDLLGVPGQEVQELADEFVVGFPPDLPHAGPGAALDVIQQAGSPEALVVGELVVRAGADREGAKQQVQGLADGVGVAVGAEVAVALALAPPHHHGPGPLVDQRHAQERVALVVPVAHVETRLVALDQAVLQQQSLDLVGDGDPVHRRRRAHHLCGAGGEVHRALEVAAHPTAQRLGLAHIDDAPVGVEELVRPGRVGDGHGGRALQHAPHGTSGGDHGPKRPPAGAMRRGSHGPSTPMAAQAIR